MIDYTIAKKSKESTNDEPGSISSDITQTKRNSILGNNRTRAIRYGYNRSDEGEHSESIYETSSYVYKNSEESYDVFSGKTIGNVYSRFTNPTVRTFEKKLAQLEYAEDAVGTASGMSALLAIFMTFLSSGDHVVCSRSVFGSTTVLLKDFIAKFNVSISFVPQSDITKWAEAITDKTRVIFCESPSNPTIELVDILELSHLASRSDAILVVDNTFCTPVSQNPLHLGADLIVHSTGKYIDGHGRCVGGAVVGNGELIDKVRSFMRSAGPAMTAHNAWVFLKGLETLDIRYREHSKSAMIIANWLSEHPAIKSVNYTGLDSHPQHTLALNQQRYHGGVITFDIDGERRQAWRCIDNLKLISATTNFGDAKSMITHPATTTHVRLSEIEKRSVGISEGLLRISVGLEDVEDIIIDLYQALALI